MASSGQSSAMNDKLPPPGSSKDLTADPYSQRAGPLSISTARPAYRSLSGQSPTAPPQSPQRTFSNPSPSAEQRERDDTTGIFSRSVPKSSGYTERNLRFAKSDGNRSPAMRSPTSPNEEMMRRRHSHEPKKNVYTECGRHSDEWLFGGWSDKVKKLWEKDKKGGDGQGPEERSQ
jgi:hypothetical protein